VLAIEGAVALEDAVAGPQCGQGQHALAGQLRTDGGSPVEAEGGAVLTQRAAGLEDQGLDVSGGAAGVAWHTGTVGPIDAVETLPMGALHPAKDRSRTDTELPCDLMEGLPTTDGSNHLTPMLNYTIALLIEASSGLFGFFRHHRECCFAGTGTPLFRRYWHLAPNA
jgi:hypothetical protein